MMEPQSDPLPDAGASPTPQENVEEPTAPHEMRSLFAYFCGGAPVASVVLIFLPLLVLSQAKYEASTNDEFIEWRKGRIDGDLCGNTTMIDDKTTYPNYIPKGEPRAFGSAGSEDYADRYERPKHYDSKCLWFPKNKEVPGLGVDYTAVQIYGTVISMILSAVTLVTIGPLADYKRLRKPLLMAGTTVWIVGLALVPAFEATSAFFGVLVVAAIATAGWALSFESCINGYATVVIWNHESLQPFRNDPAISAAIASRKAAAAETTTVGAAEEEKIQEYLNISESLSVRITMIASTCFVGYQLLSLIVQTVVVVVIPPDEKDPSDTLGLRIAILFGALLGAPPAIVGIFWMKARQGPQFPEGVSVLTLGVRRAFKTTCFLYQELPELLTFMAGRILVWITTSALLTTGVLFLEREFSMQGDEILPLLFFFMVIGVLSNLAFFALASFFHGFMHKAICGLAVIGQLIPFYILFGIKEKWEVFIWFLVGSFAMSPFNGLTKSFMTELVPRGYTSAVMSLDGCFETITAWIGPLVAGVVFQATDSLRWGMFASSIFSAMGIPVLFKISQAKGVAQRQAFEAKMGISSTSPDEQA